MANHRHMLAFINPWREVIKNTGGQTEVNLLIFAPSHVSMLLICMRDCGLVVKFNPVMGETYWGQWGLWPDNDDYEEIIGSNH